jgi:putative addiction module component (TIGR02574 family)
MAEVLRPLLMPKALEEVTKDVMDLPIRQRLALAELLIESAEAPADPEAGAAWDSEIRDRIRAIDEGRITGVAYEDVMRAAEERLVP